MTVLRLKSLDRNELIELSDKNLKKLGENIQMKKLEYLLTQTQLLTIL